MEPHLDVGSKLKQREVVIQAREKVLAQDRGFLKGTIFLFKKMAILGKSGIQPLAKFLQSHFPSNEFGSTSFDSLPACRPDLLDFLSQGLHSRLFVTHS